MSLRHLFPAVLLASAAVTAAPAEGPVIATMDELRFTPPKAKGTAELVEGKVGKAVRFHFDKDARGAFFTSPIRGTPDWDKSAGFSFWVKGDGTAQFPGIELIHDNDFAVRYDLAFPVKGTDWQKATVAWSDFVAVLPGPKAKPLGPGGNLPSKVSAFWVGRWWYWRDYPTQTFAIDDIRLEPTIDRDPKDYKPTGAPLQRVLDKLKAKKPITVVTMGDSLTDTRHWANRETDWPALLAAGVRWNYGVTARVVNPAIGGTELRQNLVLIPRWLDQAPEPDLVTVWFGGNDWNSGMRGPEFAAVCADAVARIRRATKGKADVLLMTTCPSVARWETTAELAAAVRKAAAETNAGLADTEKEFHEVGKTDKERLFVKDKVHLSPLGHTLAAETVLKAIETGGR